MKRSVLVLVWLLCCTALAAAQTKPPGSPPGPSTTLGATPTPVQQDQYELGAQDVISISVFQLEQLSCERRIENDGSITLPLIGPVQVGGLTPQQAQEAIAEQLRTKDLVKDPQVSVLVKDFRSRRVTVQGAVHQPGAFVLLRAMSLLEVIGEAGGLSEQAGRKVFVVRPLGGPGESRIEVDAERLVYAADPLVNVPIQPGDVVIVPFRQQIVIYVNGAVHTPGAQKFDDDRRPTLLQAVTSAGGTTERANESRVQIIRQRPDGAKQLIKVNLKRIRKGRAQDVPLERNDIVDVPESFF